MAINKISYLDKKINNGIDVYNETYSVTCICEDLIVKKAASIPANPAEFAQSLLHWFKGAKIYSAYEAGFSGFSLHRELIKAGIDNIVVNAASIAVAANDKVKTDLRDSRATASKFRLHQGPRSP